MEINNTNRENIRSALKALERKVLNRAGGCFSGEDAENFIEAIVFLKERGYPLAAGRDSGNNALKKQESLPEEDREVLDGLDYPSNLGKLIDEGVAEAVMKLFGKSPLFQEGYGPETPSPGDLFSAVVSCYDTRRMHADTIRQGDNIAAIIQDLLLKGIKAGPDARIGVYDMAMGTGLMLSAVAEKAGVMCPKAHVVCCGQEKDPHKYTLAKAAAMLKGLDHDYANADVIPEDRFVGQTFSLGVTGFPIETNWGKNAKEVIEEYKAIPFGRFQPGLPSVSDVQVLYLLNGISKMAGCAFGPARKRDGEHPEVCPGERPDRDHSQDQSQAKDPEVQLHLYPEQKEAGKKKREDPDHQHRERDGGRKGYSPSGI